MGSGGGGGVPVATVLKAKAGELEDEVREGFYMRISKGLTGLVKGVSGKRRFLVNFQDDFEKDVTSN